MKVIFSKTMLILTIAILAVNCKTSDNEEGNLPSCIENRINEILASEVSNPPTQVWKWEVDGNTYYYITSNCCDQYNLLYSENCEIVCAPDGGLTGQGDGKCPVFKDKIVETLIWEDTRN